jgi:hypothetical protein
MKLGLLLLLMACLIGGCCCDIGHQQMQPDPNIGASVDCYAVDDDEYCFAEAKQLCPKGYVVDSTEIVFGNRKRINFHCDAPHKGKR